ncbi:EAL domain-containing protein (plasmid) [Deinococcus taeanensis]|uniref:putative bifunctional diguanylate cyclase/phosphodiesterase n=1 Tax=Deinococcus taeanensis TaxID=2737050 RepID=UPI001CDC3B8F|nr:EAL domain-containing protein [Deinococcus taeanensis]UBV44334.1 EAL domain-containing protein [Deinococcus taeanensis]
MDHTSPERELRRLEALRRYQVLDTLPEVAFDRLTRFAGQFLQVPVVMINLVDGQRTWIKSAQGTQVRELDRATACCARTITSDQVHTIADLQAHPEYRRDGLTPQGDVRAYAGAPLVTPDGERIGALAVFDTRVRDFTPLEQRFLQDLAAIVVDSLELRLTVRLWQEAQRHSATLAHHDPLTGLPNRLLLLDRAGLAFHQAQRSGHAVGVVVLDLDGFKSVNDSLGHSVGDALLKEVGRRLSASVRHHDTVARLGGDEFVILLPELTHPADAAQVAQKLLDCLHEPVALGERHIELTASLGIAIYPMNGAGPDEHSPEAHATALLQAADTAMYEAKAAGKAHYRFFSHDMTLTAQRKVILRTQLAQAIHDGRMALHYQPQVDLHSGEVVGVEVLARWPQPDGSWVPPLEFIPLAEENHLIHDLGAWVLRTACRQLAQWHALGAVDWTLSVNVSARQWKDPAFFALVQRTLKDTGLRPGRLVLEVTEAVTVAAPHEAAVLTQAFAALGVRVALDDFGSGYTSLSQMQELSVQQLKVDRSFVARLAGTPKARAVAETIIMLGRQLGITMIAEGIETAEQRDQLQHLACQLGQGYLLGPPVPADAFYEQYARKSSAR